MEDITLWQRVAHQLHDLCASADKKWVTRPRVFDTFSLISSLIYLVNGDEKTYRTAMFDFFNESKPETALSFLQARREPPAASSFCAARRKMGASIIADIREDITAAWDDEVELSNTWKGLNVCAVDGSKLNLPKQLRHDGFQVPNKGYYPQGLLGAVFRASDRMLIDIELTHNCNERDLAVRFLDKLSSKDLVVYDRGFFSLLFLWEHLERGIPVVFRIGKGQSFPEIKQFWDSEETDIIVSLSPGKETLRKVRKHSESLDPNAIKLRLIKYRIDNEDYVLGTTILDESIKPEEFKELYAKRWMVEEFFKPYKRTIKIERFHSKSLNGVEQEIQAAALLWNLTRFMDCMVPEDFKKRKKQLKNIPLPNELPTNPHPRKQQYQESPLRSLA